MSCGMGMWWDIISLRSDSAARKSPFETREASASQELSGVNESAPGVFTDAYSCDMGSKTEASGCAVGYGRVSISSEAGEGAWRVMLRWLRAWSHNRGGTRSRRSLARIGISQGVCPTSHVAIKTSKKAKQVAVLKRPCKSFSLDYCSRGLHRLHRTCACRTLSNACS